jgi:hypothetical protein
MRPALIVIRHLEIGGRSFTHGSELPPDLLTSDEVDKLLDAGSLREYPERRSLYRLLWAFSGCSEKEHLTNDELTSCALTS